MRKLSLTDVTVAVLALTTMFMTGLGSTMFVSSPFMKKTVVALLTAILCGGLAILSILLAREVFSEEGQDESSEC